MRTGPDCAPEAAAQSCRRSSKSSSSWSSLCGQVRIVGLSSFVWWQLLVVAAGLVGVACNGG